MSERVEDQAYILHKRDYRESSYLIDLLTRNHGVVSVVAKGARTNKSKFYLNLQLFNHLDVAYSGKSDLMTLTQVDVISAAGIKQQKNIFCGYYINELILRLLHKHDQHSQIFDHYDELMSLLASNPEPEPVLRNFEKALLTEIGYGIDFSATVDGDTIDDELYYLVSPEQGVIQSTLAKTSELLVRGRTINDLEQGVFSDDNSLKESKQLMRRLLQYHLGNKPLKSRDMFAQLAGN